MGRGGFGEWEGCYLGDGDEEGCGCFGGSYECGCGDCGGSSIGVLVAELGRYIQMGGVSLRGVLSLRRRSIYGGMISSWIRTVGAHLIGLKTLMILRPLHLCTIIQPSHPSP